MTLTTGALLRRIVETPLSASAHKLATIILDGIAWKDGYNGLERGTAAFTLADLALRMGVSRQHLSDLLSELARSSLALARWKSNGKFAPWIFRFAGQEEDNTQSVVSATDDTSLYREFKNKTIFAGRIELGAESDVYRTPWANMIKAAKTNLPCWNVDTQAIWERFLAFNRVRGNENVPAGFLLGFMRRWRTSPVAVGQPEVAPTAQRAPDSQEQKLQEQIRAAPSSNRQFHASDLCRVIGQAAYDARVLEVIQQFGCARFTAKLVVHGRAVMAGEIAR